jgi:heat shock protein HslJ
MNTGFWVVLLCGLAFCVVGCKSMEPVPASPSLDGSSWVLSSLPGRTLVADSTPTAQFEAGRVAGSDGCNRYSMPYQLSDSQIRIGPVGPSTRMACPESTMEQAEAFISALIAARSVRQNDGGLELLDASNVVLARFAKQSQSLAGTSWTVTNVNNGRQAVVGVVTGSVLTIAFDEVGRAHGTTGCNQFTAAYTTEGNALRFSKVATTRRACADPALDEQEKAFLRAIESVTSIRFEGDRLDLLDRDGAMAILLIRD